MIYQPKNQYTPSLPTKTTGYSPNHTVVELCSLILFIFFFQFFSLLLISGK